MEIHCDNIRFESRVALNVYADDRATALHVVVNKKECEHVPYCEEKRDTQVQCSCVLANVQGSGETCLQATGLL